MSKQTTVLFCERTKEYASHLSLRAIAPEQFTLYQATDGDGFLALGEEASPVSKIHGFKVGEVRCAHGNDIGSTHTYLFRVRIWTPDAEGQDLINWYDEEHLPILLECDAWKAGQLVEVSCDAGREFYAFHRLSNIEALESEARERARSTQWFNRLSTRDWFSAGMSRKLYKKVLKPEDARLTCSPELPLV